MSILNENTTALQALLEQVSALPDAGETPVRPVVQEKDVNFRDYDGTVLYSYTAAEALALTELPSLPTSEGLVCQGWNWTLAEIQSYVGNNGACEIGALYTTDDGTTRIYISLQEGRTSPVLRCCPNGTVTVDWGDGSATSTITGTSLTTKKYASHTYAAHGDYVIRLTISGSVAFFGESAVGSQILASSTSTGDYRDYAYIGAIRKIEFGSGTIRLNDHAFFYAQGMDIIVMSSNVNLYGTNCFNSCYRILHLTIPRATTAIKENCFNRAYALRSVSFPPTASISGNKVFNDCFTLCRATLPTGGTTTYEYLANGARSLKHIIIPYGYTTIAAYALAYVYEIAYVRVPSTVTSIAASAFEYCTSLKKLRFDGTTPPTIANSSAFTKVPTDCVISVPIGSMATYKAATNYPSTLTYIEE